MRIWHSYGSEHSMNLVLVGTFQSLSAAEAAVERMKALQTLAEEQWNADQWRRQDDRMNAEVLEKLRELKLYDMGRADVDMAPLRVARTQFHQAHGALEMGEIAGVTKVTDAIEGFVAVFEEDPTRCDANALDAIIGGCRAIVEYLVDTYGQGRLKPPAGTDAPGASGGQRRAAGGHGRRTAARASRPSSRW